MSHKYIIFSTVIIGVLFSSLSSAIMPQSGSVAPCKEIVVVGDTSWAPYTIRSIEGVSGVGVDLIKQIFGKLDITVKEIEFTDMRSIFHGLRLGDIDILIGLYPDGQFDNYLDIIEPGYNNDPITIVMKKGRSSSIERWDDLIGQRGVMTSFFTLEQSFADYARRYLYIHRKKDLAGTLELVKKGKADYMIGSKAQLEYGLKVEDRQEALKLLENISSPTDIHMGFSKRSACHAYLPFLRRSLSELKDSDAIKLKIASYLEKAIEHSLPKVEEEEEAQPSELDYLFDFQN